MATFSRFRPQKQPLIGADDDDEEYKAIAARRLGATTPPRAATTARRTTTTVAPRQTTSANVAVAAPAPLPPAPTLGTRTTTRPATGTAAVTGTATTDLRRLAIQRMEEEDNGGVSMASSPYTKQDPVPTQQKASGTVTAMRTPAVTAEPAPRTRLPKVEAVPAFDPTDDLVRGDETRKQPPADPDFDPTDDLVRGDTVKENGRDVADDDDLTDVARARLEAEQAKERDALSGELAASKAKQLMMANARAQLAGMGLSGSTAALESDVARTADRSNTLALSQLGRSQRDEGRADRRLTAEETRADADAEFVKLQRRLAVNMLEEESGRDEDGDGLIGGLTQEQIDKQNKLEDIAGDRDAANAAEAGNFVGHIGHTIAFDGELPLPAGVDVSDARTVATVNPTDQHYVGTKGGYHYFQSASTGEFVRVEKTS